jgi:hypothetical protein
MLLMAELQRVLVWTFPLPNGYITALTSNDNAWAADVLMLTCLFLSITLQLAIFILSSPPFALCAPPTHPPFGFPED